MCCASRASCPSLQIARFTTPRPKRSMPHASVWLLAAGSKQQAARSRWVGKQDGTSTSQACIAMGHGHCIEGVPETLLPRPHPHLFAASTTSPRARIDEWRRRRTKPSDIQRFDEEICMIPRVWKDNRRPPASCQPFDVCLAPHATLEMHPSRRLPRVVRLAARDSNGEFEGVWITSTHQDFVQDARQKRLDTVPYLFDCGRRFTNGHGGKHGSVKVIEIIEMFATEILNLRRGAFWRADLLLVKPRRSV
jgi:hypothetical protein